tara:strand:+ start:527 stop:628 length:102 start_codon:yes stop_codon:yes gene_type:complete
LIKGLAACLVLPILPLDKPVSFFEEQLNALIDE